MLRARTIGSGISWEGDCNVERPARRYALRRSHLAANFAVSTVLSYRNKERECFCQIKFDTGERALISIAATPTPSVKVLRLAFGGLVPRQVIWEYNAAMAGGYNAYVENLFKMFRPPGDASVHPLDAIRDTLLPCTSLDEARRTLLRCESRSSERSMQMRTSSDPQMNSPVGIGRGSLREGLTTGLQLADKPFSKALFLRANSYQEEASRELERLVGAREPIKEAETIEEALASSSITVAHQITRDALDAAGRPNPFPPFEPPLGEARIVIAFCFFVLVGIYSSVSADGFQLEFRELAADTALRFFLFHDDEKAARYAVQGRDAFRAITSSRFRGYEEWHENLMNLVYAYVMQWLSSDAALHQPDCNHLFGRLLVELLEAPHGFSGIG